MRIFVGNVAFSTTEYDLEELLSRCGRVSYAMIATDRVTGRSRGFAFVEMPTTSEALAAIEALHGSSLMASLLRRHNKRCRECSRLGKRAARAAKRQVTA